MPRSGTVKLRPLGGRIPDEQPSFEVQAGTTSLMTALVMAMLTQMSPSAHVEVVPCTMDALGPGDVSVERTDSGRRMVIFGSSPSHTAVAYHLASGSHSLLTMDASGEELRAAIDSLSHGPPFISASLVRALTASPAHPQLNEPRVTAREREVLVLLRQGLSNAEIAARLSVSSNTVRSHLQSLSGKLDVKSRAKLAARARALELQDNRS